MKHEETLIKLDAYITYLQTPLRALEKLNRILKQEATATPLNSQEQQAIIKTYLAHPSLNNAEKARKNWAFKSDWSSVLSGGGAPGGGAAGGAAAGGGALQLHLGVDHIEEEPIRTLFQRLNKIDLSDDAAVDDVFKEIEDYPCEGTAAEAVVAETLSEDEIAQLNDTYAEWKNRSNLAQIRTSDLQHKQVIRRMMSHSPLSTDQLTSAYICNTAPMPKITTKPWKLDVGFNVEGYPLEKLDESDWEYLTSSHSKYSDEGRASPVKSEKSEVFSESGGSRPSSAMSDRGSDPGEDLDPSFKGSSPR